MHAKQLRLLPWIMIPSLIASCIEVDITVPGFPEMAQHFARSEADIQWTLTINFIGFCFASLFFGPLSDAYGRRKLMVFGFGLFTLGSIECYLSQSLELLMVSRFFQGIGASSIWVVVFAIIADAYEGDQASKMIGIMNSVLTASMAIAPIAGAFICQAYGWRSTYFVVACASAASFAMILLFLPETHKERPKFDWLVLFQNYKRLLKDPKFLVYAMAPSTLVSAYIAYVGAVSFLYIDQLQMPMSLFAIHQGCVVGSFAIVSYYTGTIQKNWGNRKCMIFSTIACLFGVGFLSLTSAYAPSEPLFFTASMMILAMGIALSYGVIFSASMEIYPKIRGAASSMIMCFRVMLCGFGVWLSGLFYTGQLLHTALVITALTLIGIMNVFAVLYSSSQNQVKA